MIRCMRGILCLAVVLLAAALPARATEALALTPEERAWISANPVVRVAADPQWTPIEYLNCGRHGGLAAEYLRAIEERTGLRFEVVPDTGWDQVGDRLRRAEVDVMPAAVSTLMAQQVAGHIVFTRPYFIGSMVVISSQAMASVHDLAQLEGKVVAFKRGGFYEAALQSAYPGIQLAPVDTAEQALQAVAEGRADAALGANATVLPFIKRRYAGKLHTAGVISNMPMELTMGVHRDKPELHSIIDKTLASFTAEETDVMIDRHFNDADYGAPSLPVLSHYYRLQLVLGAAGVLLILVFAAHAHGQHRRARRSEEEKAMFLAVMSHEIRSPMNAILGALELLRQGDLPQEARRLVRVAAEGGDNLLRLLNDVLDVSKLEAGKLELEVAPVDIAEVVGTVTGLLSVSAENKGISLVVNERSMPGRPLLLDRMRISQVLHNLTGNAIKFTQRGRVTVTVDYASATSSTGTLALVVADTGMGMDTRTQRTLFTAYTQGRTSTKAQAGGTGLGLWICRQLVEQMGGCIALESTEGQGTVVTVQVPVALCTDNEQVPTAREQSCRGITGSPQSPRVLLVEDTEANQVVLMAQLQSLGCQAMLAGDGAAALHTLERNAFDLVLMDCDLPDMTGYEVVRALRAREASYRASPTPVLAISASTGVDHTNRCFQSGMDGVLTKPISLEKLSDALLLWCDLAPTAAETTVDPEIHANRAQIVAAMRTDIAAIIAACKQGDRSLALHHAHRMVGACEVLRMTALAEAARVLEQRFLPGRAEVPSISAAERRQLEHLLQQWNEAMNALPSEDKG